MLKLYRKIVNTVGEVSRLTNLLIYGQQAPGVYAPIKYHHNRR